MMRPPPIPGQSGHHGVQFYNDSTRLCLSVADFLGDGIAAGQPVIVIATPAHRVAIVEELTRRDFDVERLTAEGEFALLDAEETLGLFMEDHMPNARRFRKAVGGVVETVCRQRDECVVRAYGEMVDLLWRGGNSDAAIRLEVLWNSLAMQYSFSLLCGYSMGNFYKQPAAIEDVCRHHTHSEILKLGGTVPAH